MNVGVVVVTSARVDLLQAESLSLKRIWIVLRSPTTAYVCTVSWHSNINLERNFGAWIRLPGLREVCLNTIRAGYEMITESSAALDSRPPEWKVTKTRMHSESCA